MVQMLLNTDLPPMPSIFSKPQEYQTVSPSALAETPGSVNMATGGWGINSFEEAIKEQELNHRQQKIREGNYNIPQSTNKQQQNIKNGMKPPSLNLSVNTNKQSELKLPLIHQRNQNHHHKAPTPYASQTAQTRKENPFLSRMPLPDDRNKMKTPIGLISTNLMEDSDDEEEELERGGIQPPLNALQNNHQSRSPKGITIDTSNRKGPLTLDTKKSHPVGRGFTIDTKRSRNRPASLKIMRNPDVKSTRNSKMHGLKIDCSRDSLNGEGGRGGTHKFKILGRSCVTPTDSLSHRNMMLNMEMIKRTSMQLNDLSAMDIPAYIAEQERKAKEQKQIESPYIPKGGQISTFHMDRVANISPRRTKMSEMVAPKRKSFGSQSNIMTDDNKKKRVSFSNRESVIFEYESDRQYYDFSSFYHLQPMTNSDET